MRALRVKKKLWDTNALIIGEIPSLAPSNLWDFPTIQSRFGVGFRQIENRELLEKQEATSKEKAQEVLDEWMRQVEEVVEPRKEELLEVTKFYLAMKEILHKNSASALGINCARLTEIKFIPPCWALAHLIDEGIPAACSADINTLIMMIILMDLSKGPSMMGNFNVNVQKKKAFISHDVIPSKMTKGKLKLYQYHYRGKGVTAYADVKKEIVTIAGLRSDLKQMFVTTGKVISSKNTGHCRIRVEIEVQHPEAIREVICADHYPMVYGDYSKELEILGKTIDIEVLKL